MTSRRFVLGWLAGGAALGGVLALGAQVPGLHAPTPRLADAVTRAQLRPPPTPSVPGAVPISRRVMLEPGSDGVLPVTVRWVHRFYAPEFAAVDDGVAYIADEEFVAVRVSDGTVLWRVGSGDGEGLTADGGVVIGAEGPDRVRVWAPYNYDLTVDRSSGDIVRRSGRAGGRVPRSITPFPRTPHERYRYAVGDRRIVARDRTGRTAFTIVNPRPWFIAGPVIEVPGGVLVMVSSGHLVALDYR